MRHDCTMYAYDIYIAHALAHDAKFAKEDAAKLKARDDARDAAYRANLAAFKASNPWPTDPTALRGRHMGLQEFIRERGD